MAFERSNGKVRPTLPRASDLAGVPAAAVPAGNRDTKGRFQPGNAVGTGRAWKYIIAKQVGRELKGEAEPLAREAWTMYLARLREMPQDGPSVRSLLADACRSAVLSGRYATRAAEVGLDSDEGRGALELSMKLSARAERTTVTALDVATKLAAAERAKPVDVHARLHEAFGEPARVTTSPQNRVLEAPGSDGSSGKQTPQGGGQ
jgi:hypothetical protein